MTDITLSALFLVISLTGSSRCHLGLARVSHRFTEVGAETLTWGITCSVSNTSRSTQRIWLSVTASPIKAFSIVIAASCEPIACLSWQSRHNARLVLAFPALALWIGITTSFLQFSKTFTNPKEAISTISVIGAHSVIRNRISVFRALYASFSAHVVLAVVSDRALIVSLAGIRTGGVNQLAFARFFVTEETFSAD